jgi:hypothetical protein
MKGLTKSEQEVLRRIITDPRRAYTFERASDGKRITNAVRKLESEGLIAVERIPIPAPAHTGHYGGTALRCRIIAERRTPNTDASGASLNGQPVNYNAQTGDTIWIGYAFYFVIDTYPGGVRLERPTKYGPEVSEWTYEKLKEARASFSDGCA